MTYNISGFANNTDLLTQFQTVNNMTAQWPVLLILFAIFIVSFIAFKSYETVTALRTSAFITGVVAVLFWTIGLLSTGKALIPAIIIGLTILFSFMTSD